MGRDTVAWLLGAGVVLVLAALAGVTLLGIGELLTVLGGQTGGDPLLVALVEAAVPYLAAAAGLVVIGLVMLVVLAVRLWRSANVPDRIESLVDYAERRDILPRAVSRRL